MENAEGKRGFVLLPHCLFVIMLFYARGFVVLIRDVAACCDNVLCLEFYYLEFGALV